MRRKSAIILTMIIMCTIIIYLIFQNNQLNQIIKTNNMGIVQESDDTVIEQASDDTEIEQESSDMDIEKNYLNTEIEHEQYLKIFNHMLKDLDIIGYVFKDGDTYPGVVIVDSNLTFNKRMVLNLTDEINTAVDDSTQKVLIYENAEANRQISIIFAFVPTYLESNMIYSFTPSVYDKSSIELSKNSCSSIINYKNIIITFIQTGVDDTDIDDIYMAIKSVQELLVEYQ